MSSNATPASKQPPDEGVSGDARAARPLQEQAIAVVCTGLPWPNCEATLTPGLTADPTSGITDAREGSALDMALCIADAEPLCEALEQWLDVSMNLLPAEVAASSAKVATDDRTGHDGSMSPEHGTHPLHLRLTGHGPSHPQTLTLALPNRALAELPACPASVTASVEIGFGEFDASCLIACVPVPAAEFDALTEGAVLLFPDTFEGTWPVELALGGMSVRGQLDGSGREDDDDPAAPGKTRAVISLPATPMHPAEVRSANEAEPDTIYAEVWLDEYIAFDPARLLCANEPVALDLPASLAQSRFVCLIDGERRFAGGVMSVGKGRGFLATEVLGAKADPDTTKAAPAPLVDEPADAAAETRTRTPNEPVDA